jgi:phosphate transport system permease protein
MYEMSPTTARRYRLSCQLDRSFTVMAWVLGLAGLALPVTIIGFLLNRGASYVTFEFITQGPAGFPLGTAGGVWPAIQGSLALVGIGLCVALPLGVGGAIYLSEYAKSARLIRVFRFITECLAGIPAIVYGLFGYSFLVIFLSLNVSLLAGGITLGLVMFPIILIGSQEAMEAVEDQFRETALSLGVTTSYMIRRIIIGKAAPGILAVTTLAAGHAFGSAAPVLYTASVIFTRGGLDLSAPVMTLPTHLYFLVGEGASFGHAYGTALVLVFILLITNFTAMALNAFMRR